jgi:hypothetical protein
MHQEEPRVGLLVVLNPELDKNAPINGNYLNETLDDPVLSPLREDPELRLRKT